MGGPASNEWLGTPAAATYLGVSPRSVYKLADTGELRGYKLGRVIRFRRADLDAYLEAHVIQPGDLTHLRADQQPGGTATRLTGRRSPPHGASGPGTWWAGTRSTPTTPSEPDRALDRARC